MNPWNDYGDDQQPAASAPAAAASQSDYQLASAVQALSDEVHQLRAEQSSRNELPPATAAPTAAAPAEELLPTDLVYRDGHETQVRNYAILGQTVYVFTSGATLHIPLADLDLAATEKANAVRGVEFVLPESR